MARCPIFHGAGTRPLPSRHFGGLKNPRQGVRRLSERSTAEDLTLAAREGYSDIELAKRYTTTGMATDQGKIGNVNAGAILAEATGKSIEQIGTTTFRPYYTPVALGAFAGPFVGHHFQPVRKTPLHEWAASLGAVFVETGFYMRSSWFPRQGEDWLASATREVMNARQHVGICDVSTLGKIDIQGKDAGVFLDRLYCNTFSTLASRTRALRCDAARRWGRLR